MEISPRNYYTTQQVARALLTLDVLTGYTLVIITIAFNFNPALFICPIEGDFVLFQ